MAQTVARMARLTVARVARMARMTQWRDSEWHGWRGSHSGASGASGTDGTSGATQSGADKKSEGFFGAGCAGVSKTRAEKQWAVKEDPPLCFRIYTHQFCMSRVLTNVINQRGGQKIRRIFWSCVCWSGGQKIRRIFWSCVCWCEDKPVQKSSGRLRKTPHSAFVFILISSA